MVSLNSFISDDANSMSSGTIYEISVPSIEVSAPADGHNEVRDGSSLEDDSISFLHFSRNSLRAAYVFLPLQKKT